MNTATVVFISTMMFSAVCGMESYQLLDGKKTAREMEKKLTTKVNQLTASGKRAPHLAIILVGTCADSAIYVKRKQEAAERIGCSTTLMKFSESVTQHELYQKINQINADTNIDGLIVQLPLPAHLEPESLIETIAPAKDVDGLHPTNVGKMRWKNTGYIPATAYGIIKLLQKYNIETKAKQVVVVGGSQIAGYPISTLLARENPAGKNHNYPCCATVMQCNKDTKDLAACTQQADILIVATGKHKLIKADMVKQGAIVIDVGIHSIATDTKNNKVEGDVDFEAVKDKCSYITPVPGGVGPMTVVALLRNTYKAAKNSLLQ